MSNVMRIVFWQNCLSPHQVPYIKKLCDDPRVDEVVLVIDEPVSAKRMAMGWGRLALDDSGVKLFEHPGVEQVESLLSKDPESSWHLFSGISAFEYVFQVLKRSLKYNINRGIITERPYTYAFGCSNGKPLWLHRLRFLMRDLKYARHIGKVFAMGSSAVDYFASVYKGWQVLHFAYCTEPYSIEPSSYAGCVRVCFVGSLSLRKSPVSIVKAVGVLPGKTKISVSFIGDGVERDAIENLAERFNVDVKVLGFQENSKVPLLLSSQDVLILPSIYDGWGAVVNEALQAGLYVICSDRCGASELLHDEKLGSVFRAGDSKQLAEKIEFAANRIDEVRADRRYRIDWAKEHISGEAIAKYMVDCLSGKRTSAPWLEAYANV